LKRRTSVRAGRRITASSAFAISKFAHLRWEKANVCLYSPLSATFLRSADPDLLRVLQAFGRPQGIAKFLANSRSPKTDIRWVKLLCDTRVLTPLGVGTQSGERQWEPHDLMFHTLSRNGNVREPPEPVGLREPAYKPRGRGQRIPLRSPVSPNRRTFWDVLARRRSTRDFAEDRLTLGQLGDLLHFSARSHRVGRSRSHRAYPSGGARYPLELYVLCPPGACASLKAGLYHYRPRDHALQTVAPFNRQARQVLERARAAAGGRVGGRWVLLTMTARMARTNAVYENLAYSLIAKEVGCLFQTLYLVAEGLGLGACALGIGQYQGIAALLRIDPLLEPEVGELIIGVCR
jgi:SagB-type dehydrogenase family enzyme